MSINNSPSESHLACLAKNNNKEAFNVRRLVNYEYYEPLITEVMYQEMINCRS